MANITFSIDMSFGDIFLHRGVAAHSSDQMSFWGSCMVSFASWWARERYVMTGMSCLLISRMYSLNVRGSGARVSKKQVISFWRKV